MNIREKISNGAVSTVGLLISGLVLGFASVSSANVEGKILVALETHVPPHCTARVGYVDYGFKDKLTEKPDFLSLAFSPTQRRFLLALAGREGLLVDFVGAAEVRAFDSFLENLRERERLLQTKGEFEFGRRKPQDSEKYEEYDLRELISESSWQNCDYEIAIEVSDWESDQISYETNFNGSNWTFENGIESADVTLKLVELASGRTVFSMIYEVAGDDMEELLDEAAADFAALLEISLWRHWIEQNIKSD